MRTVQANMSRQLAQRPRVRLLRQGWEHPSGSTPALVLLVLYLVSAPPLAVVAQRDGEEHRRRLIHAWLTHRSACGGALHQALPRASFF